MNATMFSGGNSSGQIDRYTYDDQPAIMVIRLTDDNGNYCALHVTGREELQRIVSDLNNHLAAVCDEMDESTKEEDEAAT